MFVSQGLHEFAIGFCFTSGLLHIMQSPKVNFRELLEAKFLQSRCSSCCPTKRTKALNAQFYCDYLT